MPGVPTDLAARVPRHLRELMGYSVWRGQYGHIANRDLIELLGAERVTRMIWNDQRVAEISPPSAQAE